MGEPGSLAKKIGHGFARPERLERALIHSSAPEPSYERMEFLGDRVLALALADMLFHRFPDESEGKMARRLAKLASRDALAAVARAIGLGDFVRVADRSRINDAMLADCCEAVLAAIYLDGGMAPARRFIDSAWESLIAGDPEPPRDAKTALQEWAMARALKLPDYRVVERSGPAHAPEFTVEVAVGGLPPSRGAGRTKREAEQAAAEALLEQAMQPARREG